MATITFMLNLGFIRNSVCNFPGMHLLQIVALFIQCRKEEAGDELEMVKKR